MYDMGTKNMDVHIVYVISATKNFSWKIVALGDQEDNVKINL